METLLTNEDKVSIVKQHKKSLEYNKYNIELSLLEENALTNKNQETIDSFNDQISDLDKKIAVLDTELASLQ